VAKVEPDHATAADYDERSVRAVKSVLLELGQILGSFRERYVVVGGAVPWLLLDNAEMRHAGTLDIDLDLDADALGDGQYATLVELLRARSYVQSVELKQFQLVRSVDPNDGGAPIEVLVDLLKPKSVKLKKNRPPLVAVLRVQDADGAELALQFRTTIVLQGEMPDGAGWNSVEINVASIPALLAMKGYALKGRMKEKDAYDVYYCVRNYPGGADELAKDCQAVLQTNEGHAGYVIIDEKFADLRSFGPSSVRRFVTQTALQGDRSEEQWIQDAFGQVDAWLRALGLRD
jgi:hypothetical protein